MRRGDLVSVVSPGDFGKPRPALVIQSDQFDYTGSLTVLLLSSTLISAPLFRITIQPTPGNGLKSPSQIMVDKTMSIARSRIGQIFGHLDFETMLTVERSLNAFLDLA